MTDDEKKEIQDEGAEAAGPAAAGDPPSPATTQETVPPTTSPTGEAESADAEPSEEGDAEEAPAAEAEASEPNPEDELPWKERLRLQKSRRQPRKAGPSDPEERKAVRAQERKRKAELRRKQRAAVKTGRTPGTGTPPAERESNAAKVRQGVVVSSKGDKSITVRIDIARRHRAYEKIVRSSTKLHAHDERNEAGEGDVVRVIETRPLSKTKRWRLVDVVEKAR
jgi:small subunit ribosomal protein S17